MSSNHKTKNKKHPTKNFARSPEAFPKLTLFPEGWDLDDLYDKPMKDMQKAKKNGKVATFPKTTDSIL